MYDLETIVAMNEAESYPHAVPLGPEPDPFEDVLVELFRHAPEDLRHRLLALVS